MDTILIIDDQPLQQLSLIDLLTAQGYTVLTATSGVDGLFKARYLNPNIIVLDVLMPDMNGYAVARALCDDPRTQSIPIIIRDSIQ